MEHYDVPSVVGNILNSSDLENLKPIKKRTILNDQTKAFINLIPVIGGFAAQEIQAIEQIITNYKAVDFFRKFATYIFELAETSIEERINFLKEIETTAHDYAGNVLMGMIDRLDNINKQEILANLTKARINGAISIEDFFRLSSIIERIPYVDFKLLPRYNEAYYDESGDTELLYSTGILLIAVIDANDNNKYILSELGKNFYNMA